MRPGRVIAAIVVIALCIPGLISGEAQAARPRAPHVVTGAPLT